MKVVHTAETEVEAVMLQGLLEEAGIPVVVVPRRTPFNPGALEPLGEAGTWDSADLLVPDDREAEARDLMTAYLASLKEDSRT